jgi:transposase
MPPGFIRNRKDAKFTRLGLTRFRGQVNINLKGVHDAKHTPYSEEFSRKMGELIRGGRSPQQLTKEFEPSAQAIRNWSKQAALDEGRRVQGLTITEREELQRLRRENKMRKKDGTIRGEGTRGSGIIPGGIRKASSEECLIRK